MVAPLGAPAIGELEHAVTPVEADDADRVPAEVFGVGPRHGNDAAWRIHERLVHQHPGNEAARHQVGLHLDDGVQPRIAFGAIRRRGLSLLRRGWHIDVLHDVRHTGAAADALVLDDLHHLADGHSGLLRLFAPLAIAVQRRDLLLGIRWRPTTLPA